MDRDDVRVPLRALDRAAPARPRGARGAGRGLDRRLGAAPPVHAGPVDLLDRVLDPVLGAELVDGAPALLERAVVVDDHVAAGRQPGIERLQRRPRRLVGVAVEPHHRPALTAPARAACPRRSPRRSARPARSRSGRSWRARRRPGPRGSRSARAASSAVGKPWKESATHTVRSRRRARRAWRASGSKRRRARSRPRSGRPRRSSRTTASTHACRSSSRCRPAIVVPCSGQSTPATRMLELVRRPARATAACRRCASRPTSCSARRGRRGRA